MSGYLVVLSFVAGWGGVVAVVIYAVAASFTRRASRTPNVWALVSRVVGVALLFLVGGGATPSVTDIVLLVSGTVLLLGPFLIPAPPAAWPERVR